MERKRRTMVCQVCGKEKRWSGVVPALLVRDSIVETIRKSDPDWSMSGYICVADLNHFRAEHVKNVLEEEKGEIARPVFLFFGDRSRHSPTGGDSNSHGFPPFLPFNDHP